MRRLFNTLLIALLFIATTSMAIHKFYVAIYQIEHNESKKRVEITSRIFIDDLELALEKKYTTKLDLYNLKNESNNNEFIKKYITEHFSIKINGQSKSFVFKSSEIENNVMICYFTIPEIQKIKTLEFENTVLTDVYNEQQNIIQTHFNGNRQSSLLTSEKTKGMLK
jgi:hypothetical protein